MADAIHLSEAQTKFTNEWRKMHNYWGVSEETAHAQVVLFLLQEPVAVQDLAEHMGISGQKLRAALKPLYELDMLTQVEIEGDRRLFVLCEMNIWEMIRHLVKKRIANEVLAPVKLVRECVKLSKSSGDTRQHKQFKEMLELYELAEMGYHHIDRLSTQRIRQLVHMATSALQMIDTKHSWWPGWK
jgi:DNA-binding transcriptional regulator GbsR (MarR family)